MEGAIERGAEVGRGRRGGGWKNARFRIERAKNKRKEGEARLKRLRENDKRREGGCGGKRRRSD